MAGHEFKAKGKEVLKMKKDGAVLKNLGENTEKRVSQRDEDNNYRNKKTTDGVSITEGDFCLPFPRLATPKQNLDDFTRKKIRKQRKYDISEEKHEAKLDKATHESNNLRNEIIVDKKTVFTERSELIKSEYGSISEYNKYQVAAKAECSRSVLIEKKKSISKERNSLIKSEFSSHADYKVASEFSNCSERREKLIVAKKNLLKQRNNIIIAEYGSKAKFNEVKKTDGFVQSDKLTAIDTKCAAVSDKIKTESVKLLKLADNDKVSKLKSCKSREDFVEGKIKLFKMSDKLKTVDKQLTSVSSEIKCESDKLNKFYTSHGFDDLKACNTRESFTKLQSSVLQKSEKLIALEDVYSDLGGKIDIESVKIKAYTAEKNDIITERSSLKSVRNTDKVKVESYKSKLKFTKEEGGKLETKVAKDEYKLAKAQEKLAKQRIVRKTYQFDEKSGKVKSRLKIEKEVKPISGQGGIVTKGIKGGTKAIGSAAVVGVHRQISKYEGDNSSLKALHGAEKVVEKSARFSVRTTKAVNKHTKEAPYKKAAKLKFKVEKNQGKLQFQRALSQNMEYINEKNVLKKAMRKSSVKRQYVKKAKQAKKQAETTINIAKKITEIIAKNPKVVLIIVIIILAICIFSSLLGTFTMMVSEGSGNVFASSYLSEETDIYAAENYMQALETDLQELIGEIPDILPGYNEYNFYLDTIEHEPYSLISYLSAKNIHFENNYQMNNDIETLFNAMYTLELQTVVIRGEEYNYYILNTTLVRKDFDTVVNELLAGSDTLDLYDILKDTKGNRPNLF